MNKTTKEIKKLGRKTQLTFFKTLNCGVPAFKSIQDTYNLKDDNLLKAASGLVAGLNGQASTCGFVSGGSLGLALLMDSKLDEWNTKDEIRLHSFIKEFVTSFRDKYGSEICRERIKLNFHKQRGIFGLFLPHKLYKDFSHASGSVKHLHEISNRILTEDYKEDTPEVTEVFHCAKPVLEKIREETSVENPVLEKISIALDGGVGLQGSVCGAIAASVMAINMHIGVNYNKTGYLKNLKILLTFPKNLRKKKKSSNNPFYESGKIINKFLEKAGSLECKNIVDHEFQSWKDFQDFRKTCEKCNELIELSSNETINIINTIKK